MQAKLEGFERAARDHQLAVEYEIVRLDGFECTRDLREVSLKRLLVPRLQMDLVAALVCQTAEAIVFWFELPAVCRRQSLDDLRLHRRQVERQRF